MDSLPTPPNEEVVRPQSLKRPHAVSKSIKTVHRTLKRTTTHAHPPSPARDSHSQHGDGRHKRVWKACERCRMKKTKCDGEFPCKRCKDDGLICTAGTRKKTEYKQLPPGYAEVLENTQFVLIATVQKLYSMVRNGDPWELGEPELNDRGQPVVHNVAAKLGCLRPNSDLDLPVHSIFPEDEAGMAELARQLQEHATTSTPANGPSSQNSSVEASNTYHHHHHHHHHQTDRASSSAAASDAEHSDLDLDTDYRRAAFGGAASTVSLSPASLSYADFDISPSDTGFPPTSQQSPALPTHPNSFQQQQQQQQWANSRPTSMDFSTQPQLWMAASQGFMEPDVINSGVLGSSYGMKPQGFSASCRNPGVMMGMGDPMIFSGYDEDALRPLFSGGNI